MADTSWFDGVNDPAAGDLSAIRTIHQNLSAVASAAHTAHHDLEALRHNFTDAIWEGKAADKFREQLSGSFLSKVQKLDLSYQAAAEGFSQYLAAVSEIKSESGPLAVRVRTAQARYEAATADLEAWVNGGANTHPPHQLWTTQGSRLAPAPGEGGPLHAQPLGTLAAHTGDPGPSLLADKQSEVNERWAQMQATYRQMLDLQQRRKQADGAVRDTLHTAHSLGLKNDSGWHKMWRTMSTVGKWVGVAALVIAAVVLVVALCVGTDGAFIPFLCEALSWGGGAVGGEAGMAAFLGYSGSAFQIASVGSSALGLASNIARGGPIWKDVLCAFGVVGGAGLALKVPGAMRLLGGFASRAAAGRSIAADWAAGMRFVSPTMVRGIASFGAPTLASPLALVIALGGKVPSTLSLFGLEPDPRPIVRDLRGEGSIPGLDPQRLETHALSPSARARVRKIAIALARGTLRVPGSPRTYDYPAVAPA